MTRALFLAVAAMTTLSGALGPFGTSRMAAPASALATSALAASAPAAPAHAAPAYARSVAEAAQFASTRDRIAPSGRAVPGGRAVLGDRVAQSTQSPFLGSRIAGGATGWHVEKGGRIRLVAGPVGPDGVALAALHIRLDDGYKTYWRNPGASGIPPVVSFARSRNVAAARMDLPPPHVFRDPGDVTVGYKGEVVFPVTVRPADPSRPYALRATGTVGFCARICVPVAFDVSAAGDEPMPIATSGLAVAAGQALVKPGDDMQVVRAVYHPALRRLDVHAVVPNTDVHLELVVDQPEGLVLPAAADTVHQTGTEAVFSFDLKNASRIEAGQPLRTTLVIGRFGLAGRIGVEQEIAVELPD